jgi:nicotinamide riboside kinase
MARISRGQIASEKALARNANRVLFADTDALTTLLWSDLLFGGHEPALEENAATHGHDLYLLCAPDVAFVPDAVRYAPAERDAFFERLRGELERRGRRFVVLSGGWDTRLERAIVAVQAELTRIAA